MKKSLLALALVGATACYSVAVSAAPFQYDDRQDHYDQDHDRGHDHGRDHDQDRGHDHDDGRGYDRDRDHRDYDRDRRDDHDRDRDRRDYVIVHDRGMHEGWYRRGGYVPVEYRDRRYVVDDWRAYRLAPPPPDHQWVRSDNGEFLLVAISTGIIADIILNSH